MGLIRYAFSAQLVVLAAAAASAADGPSRGAPYGVAPSAFYIGVQGGVAWARDRMTQIAQSPLFNMEMGSDAAFGGLHVGFQRVVDNVIFGLEADYDRGGRQQGQAAYTNATPTTFSRSYSFDYRSTMRARVGYDFGALELYATGGGALTNVRLNGSANGVTGANSDNAFGFGATLGAGVVYKLSRHWAAFSEYRYADFGQSSVATDTGLTAGAKAQHRITETSVRAGATYYFR